MQKIQGKAQNQAIWLLKQFDFQSMKKLTFRLAP
jgi:hypothetical protein